MSNMDAGAVNAIAELAQKTTRTEAKTVDGFPHEVMVVGPDGAAEWREHPPADIRHRVDSVFDLVRLIEAAANQGSLWVAPEGVTYVIDPEFRHDKVTCPLKITKHYEMLFNLADGMEWMTQKKMIWMLQTDFDGCVPEDVVMALRYMQFHKTTEGHGTITHGGDSMGRQVAAECKGVHGEIPEYVYCDIALFQTPGWALQQRCRIKCRMLIDTDDQRLCLSPLPGELDRAERAVLASLVHALVGAAGDDEKSAEPAVVTCPVYLGQPG